MNAAKKLQLRASEIRQRLNEINGLEGDAYSTEIRNESDTLTTEFTDVETRLRAALVVEGDERQVAEREAASLGALTGDSEVRERLELRAKTGIADFLKAAVGGSAVTGVAAEYATSLGVPTVGHVPMALFAGSTGTVETRAITPAPAVKGALQPIVPYLFERSAAASLGIEMPSVPAGQIQIAKIGTSPPSDTLAADGTAPATAAAVSLVSQAPVRIAGSFEVRVEDLAVMPTLEAALSEAMRGSLSNELDEQTFNGASGELNGLFVQATRCGGGVERRNLHHRHRAIRGAGGRATRLRPERPSRLHRQRDVRALRWPLRQRQQGRRVVVRLPIDALGQHPRE